MLSDDLWINEVTVNRLIFHFAINTLFSILRDARAMLYGRYDFRIEKKEDISMWGSFFDYKSAEPIFIVLWQSQSGICVKLSCEKHAIRLHVCALSKNTPLISIQFAFYNK